MTRDDIYDHLAQVYLGKRDKQEEKKKKEFSAWLVINIVITVIIFSSAFYGLTAFLTHNRSSLEQHIIYALNSGPIHMDYNFKGEFPPVKSFQLVVPQTDLEQYTQLQFSIRAKEEGIPGVMKVELRNKRNEVSYYYIQGIDLDWRDYSIPFEEFKQITDFTTLKEISFILESWNVDNKKGAILIDNISFSS